MIFPLHLLDVPLDEDTHDPYDYVFHTGHSVSTHAVADRHGSYSRGVHHIGMMRGKREISSASKTVYSARALALGYSFQGQFLLRVSVTCVKLCERLTSRKRLQKTKGLNSTRHLQPFSTT